MVRMLTIWEEIFLFQGHGGNSHLNRSRCDGCCYTYGQDDTDLRIVNN